MRLNVLPCLLEQTLDNTTKRDLLTLQSLFTFNSTSYYLGFAVAFYESAFGILGSFSAPIVLTVPTINGTISTDSLSELQSLFAVVS